MLSVYNGRGYTGRTLFHFVNGVLRPDPEESDGIILMDRPKFGHVRQLKHVRGVVSLSKMSEIDHAYLLLRDHCVPLMHDVAYDTRARTTRDRIQEELSNRMGEEFVLESDGDRTFLHTDSSFVPDEKNHRKRKKVYAVTSTKRGMDYFLERESGVVLQRAEFILLSEIDRHPREILKTREGEEEIKRYIRDIVTYGAERFPLVLYRFSDLSTHDLSQLAYFDDYEERELNPDLGLRGALRLLKKDRKLLRAEMDALIDVLSEHNNVHALVPYPRSVEEASAIYELFRKRSRERGLDDYSNKQIGCMVEVAKLLGHGKELSKYFDFFVVGTKDLYQSLYCADRNNPQTSSQYSLRSVANHLIPFISSIGINKPVYVTSKAVYGELLELGVKNPDRILNMHE